MSDGATVCQVYVTDSQAALLSAACQEAISRSIMLEEVTGETTPSGAVQALEDLRDFFRNVHESPTAYPVNGNTARSLKIRARRLKGPAQRRSKKHQAAYQAAKAEKRARKARQRAAS